MIPADEPVLDQQDTEIAPSRIQEVISTLGEIAKRQDLVARTQLSVSRSQALASELLSFREFLEATTMALLAEREELRRERDRLRAETNEQSDLRQQLAAIQVQLAETQANLDAARILQVQTEQRLREATRQREIADRQRSRAVHLLQQALTAITDDNVDDRVSATEAMDPQDTNAQLQDMTRQHITDDVLARMDETLTKQDAMLTEQGTELGNLTEFLDDMRAGDAGPPPDRTPEHTIPGRMMTSTDTSTDTSRTARLWRLTLPSHQVLRAGAIGWSSALLTAGGLMFAIIFLPTHGDLRPPSKPSPTSSNNSNDSFEVTSPVQNSIVEVNTFSDIRLHIEGLESDQHVWVLVNFNTSNMTFPEGECSRSSQDNYSCKHVQFGDPTNKGAIMQITPVILSGKGKDILQRYRAGFDKADPPVSFAKKGQSITVRVV
ncbi:hypothetical protein GCM10009727_89060 [Actinomadura napierensis]|uniref:Uncharacterized protein n=1 Tax=Actinomadura napierensis TaxID=267854 RepID=A0ABN3AGW6_9ACTN